MASGKRTVPLGESGRDYHHSSQDSALSITDLAIIVPALNAGGALRQALESARLISDEVILVDDGTTDGSVLDSSHIAHRVLTTTGKRGPGYARNRGAAATKRSYLIFLDADDILVPEGVARAVDYLRAHPKCVAAGYRYGYVYQGRRLLPKTATEVINADRVRAGLETPFPPSAVVIRADAFHRAEGFEELLSSDRTFPEDLDFFSRLARLGPMTRVAALGAWYRLGEQANTLKNADGLLKGELFVHALRSGGAQVGDWATYDPRPTRSQQHSYLARLLVRKAGLAWLSGQRLRAVPPLVTALIRDPKVFYLKIIKRLT